MKKKGLLQILGIMLCILVLALPNLTACQAPAPAQAPLKLIEVGCLEALTGPQAPAFASIPSGTEDYLTYANEENLVPGVKFKSLWADTMGDISKFVEICKTWKTDPDLYVVSSAQGMAHLPMAEILAKEHIIQMYDGGSAGAVTPAHETIYGTIMGYATALAACCDTIVEEWKLARPPRMGILEVDMPYGKDVELGGLQYMKARGIELSGIQLCEVAPISLTTQLLALQAAGSDYIFLQTSLGQTGAAVNDRYRLGIVIPTFLSPITPAGDLIVVCGKTAEGIRGFFKERSNPGLINPAYQTPGDKKVLQLFNKYRPQGIPSPGQWYSGWITGEVIVQAVKLAVDKVGIEGLTREALKSEGFDRIMDFESMNGCVISYWPDNHYGHVYCWPFVIEGGYIRYLPKMKYPIVTAEECFRSDFVPIGKWEDILASGKTY